MLPVLLEVAKLFPEMEAVIAGAPGAADTLYNQAREAGVNVVFGQTRNLLKTAEFAVITSGTATLEAALLNTLTFWYTRRVRSHMPLRSCS